MLKEKQMQEIQDLKLRGYSIGEIVRHYERQSLRPQSLPTIRKYYRMDAMPKTPNQNLLKDKAFDYEPYRSAIIEILRNNNKNSFYKKNVRKAFFFKAFRTISGGGEGCGRDFE